MDKQFSTWPPVLDTWTQWRLCWTEVVTPMSRTSPVTPRYSEHPPVVTWV